MRAYLIPVEGKIQTLDVEDTLETWQRLVDGYIEALAIPDDGALTAYINEEGKFTQPINRVATDYMLPRLYPNDYIAGPMVIVGFDARTGEHRDAPVTLPSRLHLVLDEAGRL